MAQASPRADRRLRAGEARLWAILIVGIAYWANIVRGTGTPEGLTVTGVVNSVLENGAFDVFAWALVLARCAAPSDDRPASRRAVVTTLLLGIVALIPARLAPAFALVLLGSTMFTGPLVSGAVRETRLVLFALAFETVWMSPLLGPLHVLVGSLDARVAALGLGALGHTAVQHGNVVENISTQFSIAVWPYCSSLFPLADVALAFLVIVIYRGRTLRCRHLPWLAASFAASIALTEIRLVLLATDAASYQWWHFGPGVSLYALAALGLSVATPVLATAGPAGGAAA